MEMEMGLKLTRVADEFSSTEFQFAKDRDGPLYQSTETDTMFILTVHLKGYMQENIKIDIDEEGTIIAITGEKPIQETVMVGWKLIKNDVEIRKFSNAFKIPDGVILDKIKARFDEEKSILTIKMPKKVKGILGVEFVEVKEHDLITQTSSEDLPTVADKIPKKVTFQEDMDRPTSESSKKAEEKEKQKVVEDHQERDSSIRKIVPQVEKELMPNVDSNIQHNDTIQEIRQSESSSSRDDQASERSKEESGEISRRMEDENVSKRSSKMCVPIVAAGSALILSLVVFVIHFIRTKNQSGKRKG